MSSLFPDVLRRFGRLSTAFLFSISLSVVAFSGCEQTTQGESTVVPKEEKIPQVGVFVVKSESVPLIRELPGRTAASNVAEVRPQVGGIVLKRLFEEGALVEEGQELYEIDSAVYQANYEKAQANLDSLERLKDRAQTLKDKQATSEQEYEDSLYAWEKAKADLELARLDLVYCKVRAPLSGKIGFSTITVGALVTNNQADAMAVVRQLDPLYVDLNPSIPLLLQTRSGGESDAEQLRPFLQGARVTLRLEDGTEYPHAGTIKRIDNSVQEDTGTLALRAEFPNPNGLLLPGMFVRAFVEEGVREDGKLIPQQALFRNAKGVPYVWVVRDDSTTEQRTIVSTRTFGNMALVDSGLEVGERVVVEGVQFVAEGATVQATEDASVPAVKSFE